MSLPPKFLRESHTPEAIRERLGASPHPYLGDFIFGAIDGTVTTFAIVAGVQGAQLDARVALALGCANLVADGFSMATSNYLSTKSEREKVTRIRRQEEFHIATIPDGEREEIRQIYAAKGFEGAILDDIVRVITEDRARWIDTMLVEEHGLKLRPASPLKAATATFGAFFVAGAVPLLPFVFSDFLSPASLFPLATYATALTFIAIGWAKGKVLARNLWFSSVETLLLGGAAAALAYAVGLLFR